MKYRIPLIMLAMAAVSHAGQINIVRPRGLLPSQTNEIIAEAVAQAETAGDLVYYPKTGGPVTGNMTVSGTATVTNTLTTKGNVSFEGDTIPFGPTAYGDGTECELYTRNAGRTTFYGGYSTGGGVLAGYGIAGTNLFGISGMLEADLFMFAFTPDGNTARRIHMLDSASALAWTLDTATGNVDHHGNDSTNAGLVSALNFRFKDETELGSIQDFVGVEILGHNRRLYNAVSAPMMDFKDDNINGLGNIQTNFVTRQYHDYAGPVTQATWNVYQFGYRPTARTLLSLFGKTQAGTVTVDIVEAATNSAWGTFTTNVTLILTTTGAKPTSMADSAVAANKLLGWQFRERGATCSNATWTLEYLGE